MNNWWQKLSDKKYFYLTILTLSCLGNNSKLVQAQVIPDNTLGSEASIVNQINEKLQQIEGGAIRGENLFHSFLKFSINEGNAVYFANPADVVNIFSRVTGNNISQILGTLGVLGNANLYLLNPNGILFGANAQLDITGSFIASSGSAFTVNGIEYNAINPQGVPILTVNTTAPVGLILEGSEGIITNEAQLTAGNNLTLVGNQVINNGNLTAINGTVNIIENNLNLESQLFNPRLQPDNTLGNENTQIESIDENNDRVIGGAERGVNLFHSFAEFNIENGRGVYFDNPEGVENILARVTGENISEIRGILGVEGVANLYFINPNGLFFNQNASLDLNGLFFASTAEAIVFDNFEYSAVNLNIHPDLIINAPTGLRFSENVGDIIVKKEGIQTDNLAVNQGQTFALIGGNITIDGVEIISPASNLILGGLKQNSIVNINPDLSLNFSEGINKSDISLTNSTILDVAGNNGGSININGENINIEDSKVLAGIAEESGFEGAKSKNILINANNSLEVENSSVANEVKLNSIGNSGNVIVNAPSIFLNNGGQISSSTNGLGNSGMVSVTAKDIKIDGTNNGVISGIFSTINNQGIGDTEGVLINTNNLSISNGGEISAAIFGKGNGGNLRINGDGEIMIDGENAPVLSCHICTNIFENAEGSTGNIILDISQLKITNGGVISASNRGKGNAGGITINAKEYITVDGVNNNGVSSRIGSVVLPNATGTSGDVIINTSRINLTNGGRIGMGNLGNGKTGTMYINATEQILLSGTALDNILNIELGGILAVSRLNNKGSNIEIQTKNLVIEDGASILVDVLGEGEGGTININTNNLTLNQGTISAQTTSGGGGNINLTVKDVLAMRNNSLISTTAGNQQTTGNGGNISIFAYYIFAIPEENSDITANAFTGKGGQIFIATEAIFGIEPRNELTFLSDITASSESGVDGTVEITGLNVNPTEGLNNLPETRDNVQITQGCNVAGKGNISFYDIGKGGLPAKPDDYLTSDNLITPWLELEVENSSKSWNLDEQKSVKILNLDSKINFSFSCI